VGLLLATTLACPRANPGTESEKGAIGAGASGHGESPVDPERFPWPSSDANPVIHLDVAMQDMKGTIEIELMPGLAPASVAEIERLVLAGYYDGTTFHRVIRGFMIQGGDPNSRDADPSNDGRGGANRALHDEPSPAPFVRGVVALANQGRRDSNSNQFFIMQSDDQSLDGKYTAIGKVVRGMDFVDSIVATPTDRVGRWGPQDRPIENVIIQSARMTGPVTATSTTPANEAAEASTSGPNPRG